MICDVWVCVVVREKGERANRSRKRRGEAQGRPKIT
jgi:hypothetical protein